MQSAHPDYLLFCGFNIRQGLGQWRFVLRPTTGGDPLEAHDIEPQARRSRLELLALVRGLEALDQPSRVVVVSPSRYMRDGIQHYLPAWKMNGWKWERFDEMVPVANCDLWKRLDRTLRFHQVECRSLRFDTAHLPPQASSAEAELAPIPRPVAFLRACNRWRRSIRRTIRETLRRSIDFLTPRELLGGHPARPA